MLPDIAIGAIGAALIGAVIALVGLIATKEGKVSDFRQAWIDALRSEISDFLTNISALADSNMIVFSDSKERFEKTREQISKLNKAYFTIALRLNIEEKPSKRMKECLVTLSIMAQDYDPDDADEFSKNRVALIEQANYLLKNEWVRVKRGERVYRIARFSAIMIIIATIGLIIFALGQRAGWWHGLL